MSGDTVIGRLAQHALDRPGAPAIVAPGLTVSYRELHAMVGGCAEWLRAQGVEPGECVGVTIPDDLTHFVVALGLASLGVAHATLASFEPAPLRARLADRVGAARVVGTRDAHRLAGFAFVGIEPATAAGWTHPPARSLRLPVASALFTYFSTSGTSGESKLIPVHHGQVALHAARAHVGRAMPLSSIEHSYAKRQFLYAVLEGATVAHRGGDATPVAHLCSSLGVDVVACMNVQAQALIAESAQAGRFPPGTVLRTSGSHCTPQFRRLLLTHVCDGVEVTYSMQECGSIASVVERDAGAVTDSVGRPHAGVEVLIVDAQGRPAPAGEAGEIRIRAPGMATGYLVDDRATARHFRDGWLCPGDLATVTPDGSLVVHGRADDVMIMNDIKIAPAEIERALARHPSVRAVAAFAVRSPVHGDVPAAAVELVAGAVASERELQAYARDALGLRAPRRVLIVAALPSTPQGKVDTRRLAEMASASVSP